MLKLRKFERTDFPLLIGWIPDARFLLQWAGPGYSFPLDEKQLIDNQRKAESHPPQKFIFKAILAPDDEVIGHIELVRHIGSLLKGRLARVLIGPAARRGQEHGAEMVRLTVKFGFEKLNFSEIDLSVFDFNHAAIACYEKIGFHRHQFIEGACRFEDESWNGYRMKLDRDEWLTNRP